jgi:hypothetical protein
LRWQAAAQFNHVIRNESLVANGTVKIVMQRPDRESAKAR